MVKNFGPEVKEKASIFVPSIGKVTIVVLLRNLLVSAVPCLLLLLPPAQEMLFMFDHLTQHVFQRLIQNRRAGDVKPAAATEKPGTIEAST